MPMQHEFDERWNGASIPQEHWHFHRQLLARYGIVLAPGEFSKMKSDLMSGRAKLVKERPRRASIYRVKITSARKSIYVVAWNGRVFTAYPPWPLRRKKAVPESNENRLAMTAAVTS